jgi:DNA-binding response OmpR family regulator
MANEKILVVDDEKQICTLIKSFLDKEQYMTYTAYDAGSALEILDQIEPELIILDVMLPDISGVDLCLEMRRKTQCPILFLSCKSEEIDKIIALSAGGDDYITKPFQSGELIARVKAHLRRNRILSSTQKQVRIFQYEGLYMNLDSHEIFLDGVEVGLTPKEFDLLWYLASNRNRVFTREQLLEHVWAYQEFYGDERTVDQHIKRLRRKIENNGSPCRITTIWGVGYKFEIREPAIV